MAAVEVLEWTLSDRRFTLVLGVKMVSQIAADMLNAHIGNTVREKYPPGGVSTGEPTTGQLFGIFLEGAVNHTACP